MYSTVHEEKPHQSANIIIQHLTYPSLSHEVFPDVSARRFWHLRSEHERALHGHSLWPSAQACNKPQAPNHREII